MITTYTIRDINSTMNTYSLLITVDGDRIADTMKIGTELSATDLSDLASKTYNLYKIALHRVYKEMESAICMEIKPSPLINIECAMDNEKIDVEKLYHEYFIIRKNKWLESSINFNGQPK